ncbi:MAG: hypothetical protein AUK47_12040 [Deltaproteobacteria bacterium CG2_30_63_29]|nr:MAG: hypothetical protein AUK47_12040 [Deltaproteobacteria bacterium CG2_30_63_29]
MTSSTPTQVKQIPGWLGELVQRANRWLALLDGEDRVVATSSSLDAIIAAHGPTPQTASALLAVFGIEAVAELEPPIEYQEVASNTGPLILSLAALEEHGLRLLTLELSGEISSVKFGNKPSQIVNLDAEEGKFRALVESANDAVITTNRRGKILDWNPAAVRMFGYTKEEALGQPINLIVPESLHRLHHAAIGRRASGPVDHPVVSPTRELKAVRKDGTAFPIELTLSRWTNADGIFFSGIIRDIEDRVILEDMLSQAQKMEALGRLAGGVAHDFNNLLTPILGYAELALIALEPDDPVSADILEIQRAASRAGNLTRQLLAFSRRQISEPRAVDLNQVVDDLSRMLRRVIGEEIELRLLPDAQLSLTWVDPGRIGQVIVNLVVNARAAVEHGGTIAIETATVTTDDEFMKEHPGALSSEHVARDERYVMLVVADNGEGINAKVAARMFEPFFTTRALGEGTGLGLSLCYGIVNQAKGHIFAESKLGEGTRFYVLLPIVEGTPSTVINTVIFRALPQGTETILLVEDDASVREFVARVLRGIGYLVLEAIDGEDAMRVFERHSPQPLRLLISDVVMPKVRGDHLAQRLKAEVPALKVLLLSGYAPRADLIRCEDAFLPKPVSPGVLARTVRELLDA